MSASYFPAVPRDVSFVHPTALHALEQAFAALLLAGGSPFLMAIAVAIWLLSGRSPFVAHLRVGQHGRPLWVLKYRTMWQCDSRRPGAGLVEYIVDRQCPGKSENDPRVTSRFARFCRRHSIDELPQLVHVARGQMSLVGPRPITAAELQEHYGVHAAEVLTARPGLTGLWQIKGRNRLSYRRRLRLDLFLVRRYCTTLYFRVLWCTVPRVLSGKDAW